MSNADQGRRRFFISVGLAIAGGPVLDALAGRAAAAQPKPELIDITEKKRKDPANKTCVQVAKGINYRDTVTQLAADIKSGKVKATPPEIKDKAGKNVAVEARTCAKCLFFRNPNPAVDNCLLINGCLVPELASCTSWSPKPGAI